METRTLTTEDTEDTEQLFQRLVRPQIATAAAFLRQLDQTGRNRTASPVLSDRVMDEEDPLTERIIGCAIIVHKALGAGLLESAYETSLCIELAKAGIRFERQRVVPLVYNGVRVGEYRPDLIVEHAVIVEVKSVLRWEPVFVAQMLTYLRITGLRRGLLLNFNKEVLRAGIKRITRFD